MTTIKRKLLIGAAALLLALTCFIGLKPTEAQAASTDTVSVSGTYNYSMASQVLTEVNNQRAKAGASSLKMDKALENEAMKRAAELSIYFSHTRPNGSSYSTAYSKLGNSWGENIAAGQSSASSVMTSWMNSSGHKANILNKNYKSIGIGSFTNNGTTYWVQIFSNSTATAVTCSGTSNVTVSVSAKPTCLSGNLRLTPSSSSINKGKTTSISAYLTNKGDSRFSAKINAGSLKWSSGSKSVATVSGGTVTGKSAGSAKITAKTSSGSASASTTITVKSTAVSISKCSVGLSKTTYTYDGTAKKPSVTVKYGSTTLKQGTDYTVSYSNNIKVGTAKVTITGKGNYTGSVSTTFTIKKAATNISKCTVSLSKTSYTYSGTAYRPSVTVKYGSTTLKSGTDYTVSYSNNVNVGTGKVTVTGKGNYTGSVTKTFTIKKATTISLSKCTISLSSTSFTYTGWAIKPVVTVKYGSTTLRYGIDYTLSYSDNFIVGTGKVQIKGCGNYSGSVTRTFQIRPKTFASDPSVDLESPAESGYSDTVDTTESGYGDTVETDGEDDVIPEYDITEPQDTENSETEPVEKESGEDETVDEEPAEAKTVITVTTEGGHEDLGSEETEEVNTEEAVPATTTDPAVMIEGPVTSATEQMDGASTPGEKYIFGLRLTSSKESAITVLFSEAAGASGYEVMYSDDSDFSDADGCHTGTVTITDHSFTGFLMSGLHSGETYYVRVRSYAADSDGSISYSDWSGCAECKIM